MSRRRLKQIVNGADTDGHAQKITRELDDATIRGVADQRQRDYHLTEPCFGDRQLEQRFVFRHGGQESLTQHCARLVRLLVDELAAHPIASRQIGDRLRSRQGLHCQAYPVALRQPRRRANASLHARTTPEKKIRVPSSVLTASNWQPV